MKLSQNYNLSSEEITDLYGHGKTEFEIMSLYPYEDREFNKEEFSGQEYTVTYDPMTAYSLRMKYPVKVWGRKYEKNHRAFVFLKQRPKAILF